MMLRGFVDHYDSVLKWSMMWDEVSREMILLRLLGNH